MSDRDEIHSALNYIDPHERDLWLKIGAALKDELGADGFAVWDHWSQRAENYQPRAARDVWKSLKPGFVRINSLFHEARQNGYAPSKPYVPPSPAEQARRAAEAGQRRQQEQRNTEAAQARARQTAQRLWARNDAAKANHPYLSAKGIHDTYIISQIKQSHYQGKSNLLIPVMQNNDIVSMQFIDPAGGKRFLSGGVLRGSHTIVGNPEQMAAGVVLAEGFATAASIYQATGKPVVVTFNAGNLPVVAGRLAQTLPPDIDVTIAADNDAGGTGIRKAQEAAALLGDRARVVMPVFTPAQIAQYQATQGAVDAEGKPKLPSDFNDLQQLAGAAAVQVQMGATATAKPQTLVQQAQAVPAQPEKTAPENTAAAWPKSERSAWGDFPPVLRNGDLGALKAEPEYQAAKSGDPQAALSLVSKLISQEAVEQVRELIGSRTPTIVPVSAIETAGNNQIPLAMANAFGQELGLPVEYGIQQANKVSRTGAGIDHRLAFQPSFTGDVEPGREYLIMDDTLSVGSTIAALKGHIENRGGKVLGAAVMTAHEGALNIVIKPAMMEAIRHKHGERMDQYWKEEFGYGIDKLTQGEAGHLRKAPDVEHIRDRIVAARNQAQSRMDGEQLHKEIRVRTEPTAVNSTVNSTQEAAPKAASVLSEPPPPPITDSPATAADQAALSHQEPAQMADTTQAEIPATANSIEYDDSRRPDLPPLQAAPAASVSGQTAAPVAEPASPAARYHESLFRHFEVGDGDHIDVYPTAAAARLAADERGSRSYTGQTFDGETIRFDKQADGWAAPVAEAAPSASPTDRTAATADAGSAPEQLDEPRPAPERTTAAPVTDLKYKAPPDGIAHRYICANGQYLAAENGTTVVFTDSGKKISTAKTDAQTVKDMLEVAKAKGWDSIKLSGSHEFKSMMYVAAESQGIRTRGYAPTPADLALVEKLRAEQSLNSIEAAVPEPAHRTAPQPAGPTATAGNRASVPKAGTRPESPPAAPAGERITAHGAAPYQNQPDKQMSYFVRLEQDGRERTVWGAGLPEALRQSGADVGDRIALHNLGRRPVEIEVPVHDGAGKVVGHEHKSVTRNVWQMEVVASRDGITTEAASAADQDRRRTAEPEPEQPDRAALSAADRMVVRSRVPDVEPVNTSANTSVPAGQDGDAPLPSIGTERIPPQAAKSAAELKSAALETSYAAAKDHYMAKADKLSQSAKAKLAFYERSTLDVIRAVTGDTRTEALRNFYENTAAKMRGSKLDLPHPMQIPSPDQSATRDAGQPKAQTLQTAEPVSRGQDEPEIER